VSHSGGDDGFVSDLVLIPDANMGLVLMCNSEHPGMRASRCRKRSFVRFMSPRGSPTNRQTDVWVS